MILASIKLTHTLIFLLLSICVLYILFCAVTNRYSRKTTMAFLLILAEGVVLILNGWRCPLTTWAENLGATHGEVADIFLPKWLADHIFDLCTPLFIGSSLLLMIRQLWTKKPWRRSP